MPDQSASFGPPQLSPSDPGFTTGLKVGQVFSAEQASGLTQAGAKLIPFGTNPTTGAPIYMLVSPPAGLTSGGGGYGGGPQTTTRNGTITTTGLSGGEFTQEELRRMPPDVRARLTKLIDQLSGRSDFGYTPEEIAKMQIDPWEAAGLISASGRPIAGAANAARDELERLAAARGNYAPGLNATVERVQQEQGRQAAEAGLSTRMAIEAANRLATQAAANARLDESGDVRRQIGGLLTSFPEGTTNRTGTSSESTSETATETGLSTSGPSTAAGTILPAQGTGTVSGGGVGTQLPSTPAGGAGVAPKVGLTPPAQQPTDLFGKPKKQAVNYAGLAF